MLLCVGYVLIIIQLKVVVLLYTDQSSSGDSGTIKATAPMWRCSRIMHLLRDLHPTLLSALEGIVDQVCSSLMYSNYTMESLLETYIIRTTLSGLVIS